MPMESQLLFCVGKSDTMCLDLILCDSQMLSHRLSMSAHAFSDILIGCLGCRHAPEGFFNLQEIFRCVFKVNGFLQQRIWTSFSGMFGFEWFWHVLTWKSVASVATTYIANKHDIIIQQEDIYELDKSFRIFQHVSNMFNQYGLTCHGQVVASSEAKDAQWLFISARWFCVLCSFSSCIPSDSREAVSSSRHSSDKVWLVSHLGPPQLLVQLIILQFSYNML